VKIAIVHDWLVTYGGAERVLEQILACYPEADLFSLVEFLPRNARQFIRNKPVRTSFLQHVPFARTHFRKYLGLMPLAVEQLDLSGYDLIISSNYCAAKGVLTGPDQLHICMCHSPIRYAWDLQEQYLQESGLDKGMRGSLARWLLHRVRLWDTRTANGVDEFIAISHFIARRIWKTYRRSSTVIYPPVDIASFVAEGNKKDDFYLTVSRLVPYKRVGLIAEAFARMPDRKLVVIGTGPQLESIEKVARRSANIEMMGFQSDGVVRECMRRANAFVFAAEEDFGISVVEAQASGTPVVAFGKGGALETIQDCSSNDPTGLFFDVQNPEAIVDAIHRFEEQRHRFTPEACRRNAARFSIERFRKEFTDLCDRTIDEATTRSLQRSKVEMPAGVAD
jgi:glycosyltransferase involved in cell wall biosynthesis